MPQHKVSAGIHRQTAHLNLILRLQSEEARNAFIGRYYFLDSLKEVAAYCGMSESKCKSLLYRTRVGLKEYLEKEGFSV